MRTNTCLLVAVCLGASLLYAPLFAADSDSGEHQFGKASTEPAEAPGSQTPAHGDDAAGAAAVKTNDDIDLRITVQPHRLGAKANKAAETKAKLAVPGAKNAHRRVFSASLAASRTGRNAISAPLAGQQIDFRRSNEQTSPVLQSKLGANGTAAAPGKPEVILRPIIPQSHVTVVVSPNAASHVISGATVGHRTANSVTSLGGPAKPVAGINGTTMRPAH